MENRLSGLVQSAWTLSWLRVAVMAESLLLVAMVFVSGHRRLHYPFALDWIEEGNLVEVGRVVHHLPLYVAPTIHYTPYIYAPLFYWLSGTLARAIGIGYPAMRIVSMVSTVGVFAAVFGFVATEAPRRSPARWLAAVLGMGLFATAYPMTRGFFDVGRVDMVCLIFAMLGLWLVRRERLVAAAACFAMAMLAKQGILPIAVLALCSDWQRPRRLLLGLGSLAALCVAPVLWLGRTSHGWSTVFLFQVAPGFRIDWRVLEFYLPHELFPAVAISLALILAGVLLAPPRRLDRASSFYVLTGIGLVLYTGFLRAHAGSAGNADIPAFLWIAFTAAVCFERLYRRFQEAPAARLLLLAVALLQMAIHTYGPQTWVPTVEQRELRERFVANVEMLPGDVLIVDHPQLALAAGKQAYADGKAMDGLITSPRLPMGAQLKTDLAALVQARHFSALVLDGMGDDRLPANFVLYYPARGLTPAFDAADAETEPAWFYLPCAPDPRSLLPELAWDESKCSSGK